MTTPRWHRIATPWSEERVLSWIAIALVLDICAMMEGELRRVLHAE